MSQPLPTLATVIVTWNRCAAVLAAIKSLKNQLHRPDQIIVVDNHSSDETVSVIKTEHPDVDLVTLDDNYGACTGRNRGTQIAQTDLVYYIDDDLTVEPECIQGMLEVFKENPWIGALQTTIVDPFYPSPLCPTHWKGRNLLWIVCLRTMGERSFIMRKRTMGATPHRMRPSIAPQVSGLRPCPHPREGSFAVRRDLLPPEPWPDHFSRAGEGPWITMSLYDRGYETVLWSQGITHHHRAPGGDRERVSYFFARNTVLTAWQRLPWFLVPWVTPYKAFRTLWNVRSRHELWNWTLAMRDALTMILKGSAKRQPITWQGCRRYFHALRRSRNCVGGGY